MKHTGGGKHIGYAPWRSRINQHETFTHDSIDSLAHDWERIADPGAAPRTPLKVYLPRTTEDVVAAVTEARQLGQVLHVRAKGHSSNDLVTPPGGAVLLTELLHGLIDVDEQAMIATVWAGTPSSDIDEELAQRGLGLPVIGDHAHVTIGGFISVGGITPSSFRHGLFIDTVHSLEYVDWEGVVHQVDRDQGTEQMLRLFTGLGRHGVVTRATIDIIRIAKYSTYWRSDDVRFKNRDQFIAGAHELLADPPGDAQFIRGLWADVPRGDRTSQLGVLSVFRQAEPLAARRALEKVSYTGLHRLGWAAGRLPTGIDRVVKTIGMAGVIYGPRYATVKNAELFTEKILDATVGEPQRFMVAIAPIDTFEQTARRMWQVFSSHREAHRCFTFLTLYVKGITSDYLARGNPERRRWVEVLFYLGINPALMTPHLLARVVDEVDQVCLDTGAYRYMHTRTGRDPQRLAALDPNAPYNQGRSQHPLDRQFQGGPHA